MPELDVFSFLNGISPWWWVAFAVGLGAVEMATFTYFLLWLALAALGTAATLWIAPGMTGVAQIAVFSGLAIALTVAGRFALARMKQTPSDTPALNRRSEQVIGRTGRALDRFDNGEGVIVVDGVRWRARLTEGSAHPEQSLTVIDADGMTLICELA